MLFQKSSYPVINPHVDCFEILKDNKIYRINHKHKNFEKKIEQFIKMELLDWEDVSRQSYFTKNMTEDFMRKHIDDLEWWSLLNSRSLSESFMREIIDYIDWFWVMNNTEFYDKNMLREFKDRAQYDIVAGEKFGWEDLFDKLVISIDEEI